MSWRAPLGVAVCFGSSFLCPSLSGCDASSEFELRQAAALDRAVDQLRNAPNPEKRDYLERLRQLPCAAEALCAFKSLCERGYAQHVSALTAVQAVKQRLNRAPPDSLELALERSRLELIAAARATEACVARQTQIRKDYQLE